MRDQIWNGETRDRAFAGVTFQEGSEKEMTDSENLSTRSAKCEGQGDLRNGADVTQQVWRCEYNGAEEAGRNGE